MSLIQLLPDQLANQIAAGEVVQRPSSVVKELLENAIDAGSTRIELVVKDAGRTLIQVTDTGSGMSAQDARMCFERHATSKIKTTGDLFNIQTLGFRGEALASIAAVAQVRLRTRLREAELGTEVEIDGGTFKSVNPCQAPVGTTFYVKNLFFNVPARRNFLKSNPVEMKHVLNEFIRVALPAPQVAMTLVHNDTSVYQLPATEPEARLTGVLGDEFRGKWLKVQGESSYARLHGWVARPETARKTRGEQFFFVNGRYIRHPYLEHAITSAFESSLPKDTYPVFALFITIEPVHVDINIHPTKTEVKFDDERSLYALVGSAVREALNHANLFGVIPAQMESPAIQRHTGLDALQLPGQRPAGGEPLRPVIPPARTEYTPPPGQRPQSSGTSSWQPPRRDFGQTPQATPAQIDALLAPLPETGPSFCRVFGDCVVAQLGGELALIHRRGAIQRLVYEQLIDAAEGVQVPSQQLLFPVALPLSVQDRAALTSVTDVLAHLGFMLNSAGEAWELTGVPPGTSEATARTVISRIASEVHLHGAADPQVLADLIAREAASAASAGTLPPMQEREARSLVEQLLHTSQPTLSPFGKTILKRFSSDDLLGLIV